MHALFPLSLCALCVFSNSPLAADDWPQYRGPTRDDISREIGLLKSWPDGGPKPLWKYADAGVGYSGTAVVGDRLYTLGDRGEDCFLIALDLSKPGEVREAWSTKIGAMFDWKGNSWSAGPSSTPTVDGDRIFTLSGMGELACVSTDGKIVWQKNLPVDLEAEVNPIGGGPKKLGWGYTWSPLVDGDRLVCIPGGPKGTVAALDKKTGDVIWRTTDVTDQAAYTSPTPAEIDGVKQYVVLTNQGLLGVSADDGKLLWTHRRKWSTEVVNSPTVRGNEVFVTIGAGGGCELIRVEKKDGAFTATSVYSNKNFANHHGNVALVDGHIYGNSQGTGWTALNFATGEIAASERKIPAGSLTYADGRFYFYSEKDGTAFLLEASPSGVKEVGKFKAGEETMLRKPKAFIWTPPTVSGGRLFLRDQELIFCYDVKG